MPCTKLRVPSRAVLSLSLPVLRLGCSQQSRLATAPQGLPNPVSSSGHTWGDQGGSSRSALAFKWRGLQPHTLFANSSIGHLEDPLSKNLNAAVTTARPGLFQNVKDAPIPEQTPVTFLPVCFMQSSSGHRPVKPVTTLTAATSFHYR